MMTRKAATLLALFLGVALAACSSDDDGSLPSDEGAAGEENADSKGDRDEAAIRALEVDLEITPGAEARKVFTSAEGFEAYFGIAAPADVDFSKEWVGFYYAGPQRSGGYSAHVSRVTVSETGKTLKVVTQLVSPGNDCFTTLAITNPYTLVRFAKPRSNPGRVRFYRDDVSHSCSEPSALEIGDADDGKTFEATAGQDIVVRLSANPTTGYRWHVTSTNRTFGYPSTDDFQTSSDAVGSGGTQTLTWKTTGPLSLVGSHTVTLSYSRGQDGEAARTFRFTVTIAE